MIINLRLKIIKKSKVVKKETPTNASLCTAETDKCDLVDIRMCYMQEMF